MSGAAVLPGDLATIRYMPDGQAPAYPLYQRVLREKSLRGWTWTQLQEQTGLARSTFNSWKSQPQPPMARTVNEVADKLAIGREEALRLAGILTDSGTDGDLVPECIYESEILATGDISDAAKRQIVRVHRDKGHAAWCQPASAPKAAAAGALTA